MGFESILFFGFFGLLFLSGISSFLRRRRQIKKRKDSLRHDSATNTYTWMGFEGQHHRSDKHPEKPGGDWHQSGETGGHNGGGFHGDLGGDGGGGGGD